MLIGKVSDDEVEVLLQALVSHWVVKQELQQDRRAELANGSYLRSDHHLLDPGHDVVYLWYHQLSLQYGLQSSHSIF